MGRGNSLNLSEGGCRQIPIHSEQEEIGYRQIIQSARDERVTPDAFERVAEDYAGAQVRVIEKLHAHVVARAKQLLFCVIPNGEGEIASQAFHASFPPGAVRAQYEFRVGPRGARKIGFPGGHPCCEKLFAGVDARVGHDPRLPIQGEGLDLALGLFCGFEEGMSEANVIFKPDSLRVWTAESQRIGEPLGKLGIERGSVELHDAGNATHERGELKIAK